MGNTGSRFIKDVKISNTFRKIALNLKYAAKKMDDEMRPFNIIWRLSGIPVTGFGYFCHCIDSETSGREDEEKTEIILLSKRKEDRQKVLRYFDSFCKIKKDDPNRRTKLYFGKHRVTVTSTDRLELFDELPKNTIFLICHSINGEIIGKYAKWLNDVNAKRKEHSCQVVLTDCYCSCIHYNNIPKEILEISPEPPIRYPADKYRLFFMKSPKHLWMAHFNDFISKAPETLRDMYKLPMPLAFFLFFVFCIPRLVAVFVLMGYI